MLSYSNRELGSDAKLYPSSVVNDLKGVLSKVVSGDFKEFEGYPLTEFAEPVQTPDGRVRSAISGGQVEDCFKGLLPSLSKKAYALAGYVVADTKKIEDKGADKEGATKAEESPRANTAEKNEFVEPTPKDLAEFVKDPFTAILKRRLGIATEGYRDHTLDDASPLGVQDGEPMWKLQNEIAKGEECFKAAFPCGQKKANAPTDFLGDFERSQFDENVEWANTHIDERSRKILQTGADTDQDQLAVICRDYKQKAGHEDIKIPPAAVLEPLFVRLSECFDQKKDDAVTFTVEVIDVGKKKAKRQSKTVGKKGSWTWRLTNSEAVSYYKAVIDCYKTFLSKANDMGTFPSVTYDKLREYFVTKENVPSNDEDWERAAKVSIEDEENEYWRDKGFNKDTVVSHVVKDFKREPTGPELRELFEAIYKSPMWGDMN